MFHRITVGDMFVLFRIGRSICVIMIPMLTVKLMEKSSGMRIVLGLKVHSTWLFSFSCMYMLNSHYL